MLRLADVREHKEDYIKRLKLRNADFSSEINEIIKLDDERKALQFKLDNLLAEQNNNAKQIGQLFKEGKGAEAQVLKEKSTELKSESTKLKEQQQLVLDQLDVLLYQVPNVPNSIVPAGKTDEDNVEVFTHGEVPELYEKAQPHWELANQYQLINFELGVKITGAGFPLYTGKGAKLQRALIAFFLDEAEKAGYSEFIPPLLVNEASGYGTGQLPDKEGQMYHVGEDNLYLIPTSEVPLTNVYRDVVLNEADFPIKLTGYTPCFRREAGSYGKDVRGLNRLHQFDKVEIVQIAHPEQSYQVLEEMTEHVKNLLIKLELPFRMVRLCGGDLGFTAALTYDMEVYSAAQQKWLEVSSISNFESFQANRLKLRYKNKEGKTSLCHSLNGSALALPRILAAILENNQHEKGIKIPSALVPYTNFEWIN